MFDGGSGFLRGILAFPDLIQSAVKNLLKSKTSFEALLGHLPPGANCSIGVAAVSGIPKPHSNDTQFIIQIKYSGVPIFTGKGVEQALGIS